MDAQKRTSKILAELITLKPSTGRVGKSWPEFFAFDTYIYTRRRAERWLEFHGFTFLCPPSTHADGWLRFDCIDRGLPDDSLVYSMFQWPEAPGVWCRRARVVG